MDDDYSLVEHTAVEVLGWRCCIRSCVHLSKMLGTATYTVGIWLTVFPHTIPDGQHKH
jgi:hypothetical protein